MVFILSLTLKLISLLGYDLAADLNCPLCNDLPLGPKFASLNSIAVHPLQVL